MCHRPLRCFAPVGGNAVGTGQITRKRAGNPWSCYDPSSDRVNSVRTGITPCALPDSDDAVDRREREGGTDGQLTPEADVTSSIEYEIRVCGAVPEAVLVEMEGVRSRVEPVQTVIRGPVPDQAALHGIINRLQRLGLDLIEVRRVPAGSAPSRQ